MAGAITTLAAPRKPLRATADPLWVRGILITLGLGFIALFLVMPLVTVFGEAFRRGAAVYFASFGDAASLHAILLTLIVAAITVPLNTLFGLAAAWTVARFKFAGRGLLISFIELPLWISPVISGLVYVLVFGSHGWWGGWLIEHNIRVIFALPGIVLATVFVTFPFVARCVIPQMEAQGQAEEEAALTLGAGGWRVFWRVTVPKIKWSLLYGIILCNARSMGEFGAVSVVSGHIRGRTNTLPLQIEILYNEYQFAAAFALASLLSLLALATLGVKAIAEARETARFKAGEDSVGTRPRTGETAIAAENSKEKTA